MKGAPRTFVISLIRGASECSKEQVDFKVNRRDHVNTCVSSLPKPLPAERRQFSTSKGLQFSLRLPKSWRARLSLDGVPCTLTRLWTCLAVPAGKKRRNEKFSFFLPLVQPQTDQCKFLIHRDRNLHVNCHLPSENTVSQIVRGQRG